MRLNAISLKKLTPGRDLSRNMAQTQTKKNQLCRSANINRRIEFKLRSALTLAGAFKHAQQLFMDGVIAGGDMALGEHVVAAVTIAKETAGLAQQN
jgi:hypothetical protein